MDTELFIDEDGHVSCVYHDELTNALKDLGSVINARACYVEPLQSEPSKWSVNVTPILKSCPPKSGNYNGCGYIGVFDTRMEALVVESEWLSRYLTTRHFCVWNGETKQFE